CPELAAWTASIAKILSALAIGPNRAASIAVSREWAVLVVVMSETRMQNPLMVPKRALRPCVDIDPECPLGTYN
ncbi:MAG: hypothetical protein EBX55_08850, partial [Betaproteobacteria bacterium]|nr:hypothetical protein [Betaproteobacteria bacterium]NDG58563.1 hypothetical protein [Betaproteobacteria bacterium]